MLGMTATLVSADTRHTLFQGLTLSLVG